MDRKIPDGWRLVSIAEFGLYYKCLLGKGVALSATWHVIGAVGDTWQEALDAAIKEVEMTDELRNGEGVGASAGGLQTSDGGGA